MTRTWFVIDRWGVRKYERPDVEFFRQLRGDPRDAWPAFAQLVVDASPQEVAKALSTAANALGFVALDVSEQPESWNEALFVFENGPNLALLEPDAVADEQILTSLLAEAVFGLLSCDGVYYGHDPDAGLLHVATYETGAQKLVWFDSVKPGPSFARVFNDDGTCTEEDSRTYALRALDLPMSSPLLDRFAFVEATLDPYGLEEVVPDRDDVPVVAVYRLEESSEPPQYRIFGF